VSTHLDRAATDDLLVAAGRGDLGAFGAFYDQTALTVFGMLHTMMADPAGAEQATERVYLHLWRHAARFDPNGKSAYALLLCIARRELINHFHDLITHNPVAKPQPATSHARSPGDTSEGTVGPPARNAGAQPMLRHGEQLQSGRRPRR